MDSEKAIWIWPKSGTETLIQFLFFILIIYFLIQFLGYLSRRNHNARQNWVRLSILATKRGLKLSQKKIIHHFFFRLKLKQQETIFDSKEQLFHLLFHYFANLDDGHSDTYLEIIHLLHFQNSSIDSYPLKSPFELQEKEMIAYRSQSNSGLAKVTTRSSEQIVLSIKGKKFHKLPQNGKMEAIVYRKGVGIQRFQGKSKKISHNHIAFIPSGQLG